MFFLGETINGENPTTSSEIESTPKVKPQNSSSVAGISPCYKGRNGSLLSIGYKGRFLLVEMLKIKME